MPVVAVFLIAIFPADGVPKFEVSPALPRYAANSVVLVVATGAITCVVGTATAWMVSMYRFPLSRLLEWALFLPLAMPAYICAYAMVDFLEYAGPIQTILRSMAGWQSAADYSFPEIRSRGGAAFVLSAALYPYVYLFARAAFRDQSQAVLEVARTLGAGPFSRFFRIGLPLARPGIVAGVAIAMMETIGDFGVVEYFSIQTLTTAIFTTWLEARNLAGAAQTSILILGFVFALVFLERVGRSRLRFTGGGHPESSETKIRLVGNRGLIASVFCTIPLLVGFVVPCSVMTAHAVANPEEWFQQDLLRSGINSIVTGGIAAVLTVSLAIIFAYGARTAGGRMLTILSSATAIGYAFPGAVLALGLLVPLASVDHAVADLTVRYLGYDPGLLMTGSAVALTIAYSIRFFAIAQGAADAAVGRVLPSLGLVARTLGQSPMGALKRVFLPLIGGSLWVALLLVFVECVKELPATLLLRPFNYNTLATRVYEEASLENIGEASPAALVVTFVGAVGVLLLARARAHSTRSGD